MAMTREYLELVENGIDIAPVGSQEEVQAAEFILDAFNEHGLETELQDLSAPLYGRAITGIVLMLTMLAMVLAGLGGIGWALGGFLSELVLAAYLVTDYFGTNPLESMGPRAESQNVVGIHRGEGPKAGRGVRPIVVLTRYDTGREELLYGSGLAQFIPMLKASIPWCLVIVVVCALLQLFQFMAGPALITIWIIGMVAALPLVILGVNDATSPFLNLTDGANDNKASLASLFGVLEDVVPTDEERLRVRAAQFARAQDGDEEEDEESGVIYEEYEEYEEVPVIGVRHGSQVLEAIGMLPPTCEIVYEKPAPRLVVKQRVVEAPPRKAEAPSTVRAVPRPPVPEESLTTVRVVPREPRDVSRETLADGEQPTESRAEANDALYEPSGDTGPRLVVVGGTGSREPLVPSRLDAGGDTRPFEVVRGTRTRANEEPRGEAPEPEPSASVPEPPAREPASPSRREQLASVGDPTWGASEFSPREEPARAHRSLLFDLPDPTEEVRDPLLVDVDGGPGLGDQPTELVRPPVVEVITSDRVPAEEEGDEVEGEPEEDAYDDAPASGPASRLRGLLHHHGGRTGGDRGASSVAASLKERLPFVRRKQEEESLSEWLDVDEDFDARTEGEEIGSWENFDGGEEDDWRGGAARSRNAREALERLRARTAGLEERIHSHGDLDGAVENAEGRIPPSEVVDQVFDEMGPDEDGEGPRVGVLEIDDLPPDDGGEEAALASLDEDPARRDEVVPDVGLIGADDDQLVESVLDMGDVDLVAHDIWFVCVGASALGHAGTKAFVAAHRKELRGCFIVNLDSIGAGELTALTSEGYGDTRRGDRKITRLLDQATKVIHVPLTLAAHDWEDTDVTPALRRSMRGLTLMGTVGGKIRSLAHTTEDVAENLNPNQVVYVSQLVSEIIRRA